jgi:hypothetical protein
MKLPATALHRNFLAAVASFFHWSYSGILLKPQSVSTLPRLNPHQRLLVVLELLFREANPTEYGSHHAVVGFVHRLALPKAKPDYLLTD